MGASRHEPVGERRAIAVALAGVAGFVDAVGFLSLDLFTAHMSGNSARLGVYWGRGLLLRAAPSAFAIAVFVISIGVATLAMELMTRARWRSPAAVVLVAETVLLLVLATVGGVVSSHGRIPPASVGSYYPLAAAAVAAMGIQTSALQRVSGRTVRTTYVSGMLTNFAEEVVAWLTKRDAPDEPQQASFLSGELGLSAGPASLRRMRLIATIWCAYSASAVGGAYLETRWHLACLAVPVVALCAIVAVEVRKPMEARAAGGQRPASGCGAAAPPASARRADDAR